MPLVFGVDVKKKKRKGQPNGYAAEPGRGPAGETCGTCKHFRRMEYRRKYFKCALMQAAWTHGPGSDILKSAPACRLWEKPELVEKVEQCLNQKGP